MKLFLVALCVAAVAADRLENTYLPPSSAKTAGGSGSFLNAPRQSLSGPRVSGSISGSGASFSHSSSSSGSSSGSYSSGPTSAPIAILRLNNDNNGDGAYKFEFETENRIQASESGQLKNAGTDQETNIVQGSYTYTGDDGQTYTVNYVADENGFQPQGAHLPVAPAIPEEILKALEQNAADEAAGIVDDGQYRPEHEGPSGGRAGGAGGAGGAGNRQYIAPRPNSNQQQGSAGYRY